jgi:hypothetical protein
MVSFFSRKFQSILICFLIDFVEKLKCHIFSFVGIHTGKVLFQFLKWKFFKESMKEIASFCIHQTLD